MSKMRIGVDVRGLLTGKISGVEQYTIQILRHLLAIDQHNTYVLFYVSYRNLDQVFADLVAQYPWLRAANVEVRTLRWVDFPLLLHALFKPLDWPKIDRVCGGLDVMFMPAPRLLPISRACAKVTTFHDLIFMIHPEFFTTSSRLWQWQMSYGYEARTSDAILAMSHNTKRDLIRLTGTNPGKVSVVWEGVGSEYFEDHSPLTKNLRTKFDLPDQYIYFVGSLEPRKNLATIIRSLPSIRQRVSGTIKLVISGQKSWLFESTQSLIAELNLQDAVIFTGPVSESEKIALLQGASVFVFPSVYEGFGLMVLEAFAASCPVVASRNSSLTEITGDAGLVVPTFDTDAWSDAVSQILTDKNLSQNLVRKGLARAKEFSWTLAAQKTLDILNHAVKLHDKSRS